MKIHLLPFLLIVIGFSLVSCKSDDEAEAAPEGEVITDVRLIFTPVGGGAPLIVRASTADPAGEGANDLEPQGPIHLDTNTSYQLFIQPENLLTNEDVGDKIEEQGEEYMFFFEFTDDLFANPSGDGNIDAREPQTVEYHDSDGNGQPIGLITAWVTGDETEGTFRFVLSYQPDIKSEASTVADGFPTLDISWQVSID